MIPPGDEAPTARPSTRDATDDATGPAGATATSAGAGGRDRRWLIALTAGVLVVAAVAIAGLARNRGDGSDTVTRPPATTSQPATSTTGAPTSATAADATPPTTVGSSAADDLAAFFSAADAMDDQLQAAADAINGTGPPWTAISEDVATTVATADLGPVVVAIPAGLPPELLRPVILVTSDLSSRRAAMESFSYAGPAPRPQDRDLLAELANGHAAAGRFDGYLADARAAAEAHAPVDIAAPGSRAAAELALLVEYVRVANYGCDSRGGAVVTELPTITWQSDSHGTIGPAEAGMEFDVTLRADGTWQALFNVC